MTSFIDDADIVDPSTIESSGPSYPVAQWLNGDPKLAAMGGIMHTGGLALPVKYVDDAVAPPPGWTRANVAFSSGKTEQVLAAQKPALAVIRSRFRWFVKSNGVDTYYPRASYVAGMRGHVQVLCAVRGFEFPIVLTFKGKASQEFERLLKEFGEKVQGGAAKLAKGKAFPRFAFWLRLAPGPHVKAGQKGQESIITPPMLELPQAMTQEYLSKCYVGRESLIAFQGYYHVAAEWAAAWDKAGAEAEPDHGASWDEEPPSKQADPVTGELPPRNNPANAPDDFDEFGHDEAPEPPAKRKPATLNIGDGRKWLLATKSLAKKHPHYASGGQPQMNHILNAAAAEGFTEINNGNMDSVIEALDQRIAEKA